jgi:hypothetical protein
MKGLSWIAIVYLLGGGTALGLYGLASYTGWEPQQEPRTHLPADVRTSPGGYRSHHFWYRGYHGGK